MLYFRITRHKQIPTKKNDNTVSLYVHQTPFPNIILNQKLYCWMIYPRIYFANRPRTYSHAHTPKYIYIFSNSPSPYTVAQIRNKLMNTKKKNTYLTQTQTRSAGEVCKFNINIIIIFIYTNSNVGHLIEFIMLEDPQMYLHYLPNSVEYSCENE